jgi:hypothetical protein
MTLPGYRPNPSPRERARELGQDRHPSHWLTSWMRSANDRLYARTLGPRELEALRLIEDRPGLTVAELQAALGVGRSRVWQIVSRLEVSRVRRAPG